MGEGGWWKVTGRNGDIDEGREIVDLEVGELGTFGLS